MPGPAVLDQAIVVGIGRYPNFGPDGASANDLLGAVADAREVANWLVTSAGANVRLITSDGNGSDVWTQQDLRPTETDVKLSFRSFLAGNGAHVATRLYVYMAGHGFAPEPRTRCLILADALGTTDLPNFEAPAWIDWFATQYHFDELVLWMDCCATQTFDYPPGVPTMRRTIARTGPPARVFMAFGSGVGRSAYEGPIGPDGAMRGLFTDRLLRGLKGAAADENGEVRSASLKSYLYNGSASTVGGPRDKVVAEPMVPQDDDMLFAVAAPLPAYRIRARTADGALLGDGTQVQLLDGLLQPRGSAIVQDGHVSFRLAAGLYRLQGPGLSRILDIGAETPLDME